MGVRCKSTVCVKLARSLCLSLCLSFPDNGLGDQLSFVIPSLYSHAVGVLEALEKRSLLLAEFTRWLEIDSLSERMIVLVPFYPHDRVILFMAFEFDDKIADCGGFEIRAFARGSESEATVVVKLSILEDSRAIDPTAQGTPGGRLMIGSCNRYLDSRFCATICGTTCDIFIQSSDGR